jgi:hypothetical protein
MPELMVFNRQRTYTERVSEVIATTNAFYAVGVGSAYGVLEYCASKGNSVDEYISKVQLGTINNTTTGGTGYSDYTSTSTNLTKGVSSTLLLHLHGLEQNTMTVMRYGSITIKTVILAMLRISME